MNLIDSAWLALNIGNSRLHWALFQDDQIQGRWDTPHISGHLADWLSRCCPDRILSAINLANQLTASDAVEELWLASVVPTQANYWRDYPKLNAIQLSDIPIRQLYATLGLDRALALWGAIQTYGSPALVIDCGTAMTFTGANARHELIGGAIAPGVRLQCQSLGTHTAALPTVTQVNARPSRWARDTVSAIESGVLHLILAGMRDFIADWHQQVGDSAIVLTGGDAEFIYALLELEHVRLDLDLAFWGLRSIRKRHI